MLSRKEAVGIPATSFVVAVVGHATTTSHKLRPLWHLSLVAATTKEVARIAAASFRDKNAGSFRNSTVPRAYRFPPWIHAEGMTFTHKPLALGHRVSLRIVIMTTVGMLLKLKGMVKGIWRLCTASWEWWAMNGEFKREKKYQLLCSNEGFGNQRQSHSLDSNFPWMWMNDAHFGDTTKWLKEYSKQNMWTYFWQEVQCSCWPSDIHLKSLIHILFARSMSVFKAISSPVSADNSACTGLPSSSSISVTNKQKYILYDTY